MEHLLIQSANEEQEHVAIVGGGHQMLVSFTFLDTFPGV